MNPHSKLVDALTDALLAVDRVAAEGVLKGEQAGTRRLEDLIVSALERIGNEWERGTVSLAQVYMAGRVCEGLMDRLMGPEAPSGAGTAEIAISVLSDHHMLGKRMVSSVLRSAGFGVLDYGGGVDPGQAAERALGDGVRILMISTLMLPSSLKVRELMDCLGDDPRRPRVVVGGAPFRLDDELWTRVGADAMGRTPSDAVRIARDILRRAA